MSSVITETERLRLRVFRLEDTEEFAQINSNSKVMEFFPKKLTYQETKNFVEGIISHQNQFGYSFYAAELKEEANKFIGFIGLSTPSFEAHFTPAVEIGWRLNSVYWQRGLATEGARAVMEYGFKELNLEEIVSFTSIKNKASINLMQKLGMHNKEKDNFYHPKLSKQHPLSWHVLYRKENPYTKKT